MIQNILKENMAEYGLYLAYIGIFVNENQEYASASQKGYDFSFDNNFVNAFKILENTNKKVLPEENKLGELRSFYSSYNTGSYYCGLLNEHYLLIVFNSAFNNVAFLVELVKRITAEFNRVMKL